GRGGGQQAGQQAGEELGEHDRLVAARAEAAEAEVPGEQAARGTAALAEVSLLAVGSSRGAVPGSLPVRLLGPPSEPDVRVTTHPALHESMPMFQPLCLRVVWTMATVWSPRDTGSGRWPPSWGRT